MLGPQGVHEIYFQFQGSLKELYEKLQITCNWPSTNNGDTQEGRHEETGTPFFAIQTNGVELILVPNEGPFFVSQYKHYQYYLFMRWNAVDRDVAKKLYSPFLRILGNLFYRSGYEIEVDSILTQRTRDEIKKNDPVMEIEDAINNENLLGL